MKAMTITEAFSDNFPSNIKKIGLVSAALEIQESSKN
jgi:hypothetical protein